MCSISITALRLCFLYILKVFGIISPTPRCTATAASSSTSAGGPSHSESLPAEVVPGKRRAGRPKKVTVVTTATLPPQADAAHIAAQGVAMAPLCMLPGLPHEDMRKAYLDSMPSKTSAETLRLTEGMRLFRPSPSIITSLVEKVSFVCCGVKRTPLAYRKTGNYIRQDVCYCMCVCV
jgi:hypothetical protein